MIDIKWKNTFKIDILACFDYSKKSILVFRMLYTQTYSWKFSYKKIIISKITEYHLLPKIFNAVSVLYSVLVYFSFNVVFPFSLCLSLRKSRSEVRYEIRWRKMHLRSNNRKRGLAIRRTCERVKSRGRGDSSSLPASFIKLTCSHSRGGTINPLMS